MSVVLFSRELSMDEELFDLFSNLFANSSSILLKNNPDIQSGPGALAGLMENTASLTSSLVTSLVSRSFIVAVTLELKPSNMWSKFPSLPALKRLLK